MFCIAQRSEHMGGRVVGDARSRPIINNRDEPLSQTPIATGGCT